LGETSQHGSGCSRFVLKLKERAPGVNAVGARWVRGGGMARLEARTEFRERDRRHGGVEPGPLIVTRNDDGITMIRKSIALLVSTSMPSACYSFRGPEPVFGPRGVVAADRNGARTGPLFLRFRSAAMAAANCSDGHAAADNNPSLPPDVTCSPTPAGADPTRDEVMKKFMRAGYAAAAAAAGTRSGAIQEHQHQCSPIAQPRFLLGLP
jgi:hypothetical protein